MSVWLQQFQDAGSSMTGSLHKAVLCVRRVQFKGTMNRGISETLRTAEQENAVVAAAAVLRLQNDMRGAVSSTSSLGKLKEMAGSDFCTVRVQYNPASITFSSTADKTAHAGGIGDAGVNDNTQITTPPETTMKVTLVFDAVNVKDAFQWEKYRLSAGDLAQGVTALANRNSYRVDEEVNALLALTVHGAVRHVVFHWSDLTFAGELTNVTAHYTMFSPVGRPVRADVTLTIRQKYETYESDSEAYWDSAYRKLFDGIGKGGLRDGGF